MFHTLHRQATDRWINILKNVIRIGKCKKPHAKELILHYNHTLRTVWNILSVYTFPATRFLGRYLALPSSRLMKYFRSTTRKFHGTLFRLKKTCLLVFFGLLANGLSGLQVVDDSNRKIQWQITFWAYSCSISIWVLNDVRMKYICGLSQYCKPFVHYFLFYVIFCYYPVIEEKTSDARVVRNFFLPITHIQVFNWLGLYKCIGVEQHIYA